MNCPRCSVPLEWKPGNGGGLNCCPACQGFWLDNAALREARQKFQADLADDFSALPGTRTSAIKCPGDGAAMLTITHRGVEVDTCPDCKGLWLDKGEWEKLIDSRRSPGAPAAGIAAAAGVAALAAGTAAAAAQTNQSSESFLNRVRGTSNQGDVVCDIVESSTDGLLEGTFSLIGSICSSIFD
jgi:Zn-finger nucleic acid-binding protein